MYKMPISEVSPVWERWVRTGTAFAVCLKWPREDALVESNLELSIWSQKKKSLPPKHEAPPLQFTPQPFQRGMGSSYLELS